MIDQISHFINYFIFFKVFLNEHRNHWYSTGTYYLSKTLFEFFRFSIFGYLVSLIIYFGSSQPDVIYWYQGFWEIPPRFSQFLIYFYIGLFNMQCLLMIIAGLSLKSENPFENSLIIAISFCIILILGSGFFIPVYKMPYFVKILNFPNNLKLYIELLIINLYSGRCEVTSSVFNSYGISESQLTYNLYTLIIEGIVLTIIGFIIILIKSK